MTTFEPAPRPAQRCGAAARRGPERPQPPGRADADTAGAMARGLAVDIASWRAGQADGRRGAPWRPPAGADTLSYALGHYAGETAPRRPPQPQEEPR